MDAPIETVGGSKSSYILRLCVDGKEKFQCTICKRILSSKRNAHYHLHSAHGKSPVKREKKKYLDDQNIPIPRSTLFKKRKLLLMPNDNENSETSNSGNLTVENSGRDCNINTCDNVSTRTAAMDNSGLDCNVHVNAFDNVLTCTADTVTCSNSEVMSVSDSEVPSSTDSDVDIFSDIEMQYDSDDSDFGTDSSTDSEFQPEVNLTQMDKEMLLLSCFIRNSLPASACKDILSTLKTSFPECASLKQIKYERLWKSVESKLDDIHYCEKCSCIFPEDPDEYSCRNVGCSGLRYKGANQTSRSRQPRTSFVLTDIADQIRNLLEMPGMWDDILWNKRKRQERNQTRANILTDITDGSLYKQMEDNFILSENTLTLTLNTDGICLYSSTKVQLWPLYLVVNELSPGIRFARDNLILGGIWQGRGKPPMKEYLQEFSSRMNDLYDNGILVKVDGQTVNVKLAVICATLDLPAKSAVLNMRQFNGADSCISCEEPGKTVKQGKGHCRSFPFRKEDERPATRTEESVRNAMSQSTESNIIKGFKGTSGLMDLRGYQLVHGTVPDYMHCVLLGIVKSLMSLWFSPTHSKEDYFIGNKLQSISNRLQNMSPPESMERLPRDLEKNYSSFKATELQAWLIYYAVPCLQGICKDIYLEHFSLLSEGIYILLGDTIASEELSRAKSLLNSFYSNFSALYGEGACGLNVHNLGSHLVGYVTLLGPIWAWSCFPFEDFNSSIMKHVHGTGNVTYQVVKLKQVQSLLRNNFQHKVNSFVWKKLEEAENCQVAGTSKSLCEDQYTPVIFQTLNTNDKINIRKAFRVVCGGKRFYSKQYFRMRKRNCYTVLTKSGDVVVVLYFVFHKDEKIVFAVTLPLMFDSNHFVHAGRHLIKVQYGTNHKLCNVKDLTENVWFLESENGKFIVRAPNIHGHSVFK